MSGLLEGADWGGQGRLLTSIANGIFCLVLPESQKANLCSLGGQLPSIVAEDMKAQCVSHWLLGMVFVLCSVHIYSLRRCLVSVDMRLLEKSFQEIRRTLVSMGCLKESVCLTLQFRVQGKSLPVACEGSH